MTMSCTKDSSWSFNGHFSSVSFVDMMSIKLLDGKYDFGLTVGVDCATDCQKFSDFRGYVTTVDSTAILNK